MQVFPVLVKPGLQVQLDPEALAFLGMIEVFSGDVEVCELDFKQIYFLNY